MEVVNGGTVSGLLKDIKIPKMFHASQAFPRAVIRPEEIPAVVIAELKKEDISALILPGMSIAITAGSRGIRNVDIKPERSLLLLKRKGHFHLLSRLWEAMVELLPKDRKKFWKATILPKRVWDAR